MVRHNPHTAQADPAGRFAHGVFLRLPPRRQNAGISGSSATVRGEQMDRSATVPGTSMTFRTQSPDG